MTKAKRFSDLTLAEQTEILNDSQYQQYAQRIVVEDWLFSKIEKGKYAGVWSTYLAF